MRRRRMRNTKKNLKRRRRRMTTAAESVALVLMKQIYKELETMKKDLKEMQATLRRIEENGVTATLDIAELMENVESSQDEEEEEA